MTALILKSSKIPEFGKDPALWSIFKLEFLAMSRFSKPAIKKRLVGQTKDATEFSPSSTEQPPNWQVQTSTFRVIMAFELQKYFF